MRISIVALCLTIVACDPAPVSVGDPGRTRQTPAERDRSSVAVPEGAIEIRDGFYMVPLAEPVAGCPAYRAFSTLGPVAQAIYFRTADGRFVLDRTEAECG